MRAFACVVGAKSASWRSGVCDAIRPHRKFVHIVNSSILQNSSTLQFTHVAIHPYCKIHPRCKFVHITIHPCGWANCNSPLRVCYPNVGKYYMQIASRAWHRFFCVRRRGELKFAHTAICPCYKFVHIVNSSILKFAHTAICLLRSLKIAGSGRRQRCYV